MVRCTPLTPVLWETRGYLKILERHKQIQPPQIYTNKIPKYDFTDVQLGETNGFIDFLSED